MAFDDSDVKIFKEDKKEEKITDSYDEVSIIAEMTKHRTNGNLDKAKQLGKYLAQIFADEPQLLSDLEEEIGTIQRDDHLMYQMKVLLIFTAEYCLNHYMTTPLLSSASVNAMYSSVRKNCPEFYDRLDDAAEYSFYYLAVRKGVEISKNIGLSFAMLCGKENDSYYVNLGTRLFEVAKHEIKKITKSYNFAK